MKFTFKSFAKLFIGRRVVLFTTGSPRGLNGTLEPARFQGVILKVGSDFISLVTDDRQRVILRNDEIVALTPAALRASTRNKRRTIGKR